MKLFLILGCWGVNRDGIILCPSVSNKILDLSLNTTMNTGISNYLDQNLKLFDKPLYNNVHSAIYNIQDKFSEPDNPVFSSFRMLEEFCKFHNRCSLYLKLELEE